MGEFVRLEVRDAVATIRLDRPPANAIDERLSLELWDAVKAVAGDETIRAAVIWGGERVFSAGADIGEMADLGPRDIAPVVGALESALRHLEAVPKIVIAAINGDALGGGCEIAMCADTRFAAEDARLGQPEIRMGIMPGAGGTQRLPRLVGQQKARELIYTGREVDAAEGLEVGLVERVLPAAEVYPAALEEAAKYAAGPTLAYRAAKLALNAAVRGSQEAGLEIERELFHDLFATRDQKEGMRAFLEKREPRFEGK